MYFTGNPSIDYLLNEDELHWDGSGRFNDSASISFSFARFDVPEVELDEVQTQFNQAQKVAARLALAQWAAVANVTFNEVTDTGLFIGNSVTRGDINFTNGAFQSNQVLARTFFPSSISTIGTPIDARLTEESGDVHFNANIADNLNSASLQPHGRAFSVMMHELGHSLGLGHPEDSPVTAPAGQDNDRFTVMISNIGKGVFFNADIFPSTLMVNDIQAIQHIYGANLSHNSGNTTYAFTDSEVIFETIWDGGGSDRIDLSASSKRAIIDLTPGSFSSVGVQPGTANAAATDNLAIAFGAIIEHAEGGSAGDTLTGNTADNDLVGNGGADRLTGALGDDTLTGSAGNDTLVGGNGADRLIGGAGDNRLVGGAGNDVYILSGNTDVVVESLAGGNDQVQSSVTHILSSSVEKLKLTGSAPIDGTGNGGANTITGNAQANALVGLAGNDRLNGAGGNDTLLGGGNDDTLSGGAGSDLMRGNAGDDTYVVNAAGDQVIEQPGQGADFVQSLIDFTLGANVEDLQIKGTADRNGSGNALANAIAGNSGDNLLRGLQGADTLLGGSGADKLDGGGGADEMRGGTGDDTYVVNIAGDQVTENAGQGSDTVQSLIDFALGANFEHLRLAGTANRSGTGNGLDNQVTGNIGANQLRGLIGDDTLAGSQGNDTLAGGQGSDRLNGGAGGDRMAGGAGDDSYIANNAGDVVVEQSGQGTDHVTSTINHNLAANVEHLTLAGGANRAGRGNDLDNEIFGNAGDNTLRGLAGDDTLRGRAGDDSLLGGTGNDLLVGDAGDDTMLGGAGNDTYVVNSAGDVIIEPNPGGIDLVRSNVDHTLAGSVENLRFVGAGDLDGVGNGRDNAMTGNSGDNLLRGFGGNDTLVGAGGTDRLLGGGGDDRLIGGTGNDTLGGGVGADAFIFAGAFGADTLSDFAAGPGSDDLLDFSALGLAFGDLAIALSGGTDTLITTPGGASVLLSNVAPGDLDQADDFAF